MPSGTPPARRALDLERDDPSARPRPPVAPPRAEPSARTLRAVAAGSLRVASAVSASTRSLFRYLAHHGLAAGDAARGAAASDGVADAPARRSAESYLASPSSLHERVVAFQYEGDPSPAGGAAADEGYLRSLTDAAAHLDAAFNAQCPDSVMLLDISPPDVDAFDGERTAAAREMFGGPDRRARCPAQWEYPRCVGVVQMDVLLDICAKMHAWLGEYESRTVCLHARAGAGAGAAAALRFVAACYLCYSGEHEFAADALDAVATPPPAYAAKILAGAGHQGGGGVPSRDARGGGPGFEGPGSGGSDSSLTGFGIRAKVRETFGFRRRAPGETRSTRSPLRKFSYLSPNAPLDVPTGFEPDGAASTLGSPSRRRYMGFETDRAMRDPPLAGSRIATAAQRRYAQWLVAAMDAFASGEKSRRRARPGRVPAPPRRAARLAGRPRDRPVARRPGLARAGRRRRVAPVRARALPRRTRRRELRPGRRRAPETVRSVR